MDDLKNMQLLSAAVRSRVEPFMKDILRIHGENIVSIFICGSSLSQDMARGKALIESVVVFKKLDFDQLHMSLSVVDRGIKRSIAAPLFLTPGHIKTSVDTFPLEFLEMKENHLLIYGQDLLEDLRIDLANIRFVCEEQLKGKLIRIRQAYLEIGLRRKGMEALIKESLDSLFPVFKALLRLKDITPPSQKSQVVAKLSEAFGIEEDVFNAVLSDTQDDEKIGAEALESFLARYIKQIETLAEIADRL